MSRKQSNPKDIVGVRKIPFSMVPTQVIAEENLAFLEGARKYGRHNYRVIGVSASIYYDAFMRHVNAWWEGENIDKESGIHHLSKARACLAILRDAEMNGILTDDRPPKVKNKNWIQDMSKKAEDIIKRHPNPVDPFTEK